MRNADLYAQYNADCLRFTEQADADEERLSELNSDDEFSDSYRTYLEKRRDWNRCLADNARERAEYFGGGE